MHKNTNTLRALAAGFAVIMLGTAASLHATPAASHRAVSVLAVSDTTPKDTTTKPDTTKPKPDTTKKH